MRATVPIQVLHKTSWYVYGMKLPLAQKSLDLSYYSALFDIL